MADFNVWGYLARLGTRVLSPGDATFQSGDEVCAVNEPILLVLQDVEEFLHQEYQEFQCSAPGNMFLVAQLLQFKGFVLDPLYFFIKLNIQTFQLLIVILKG